MQTSNLFTSFRYIFLLQYTPTQQTWDLLIGLIINIQHIPIQIRHLYMVLSFFLQILDKDLHLIEVLSAKVDLLDACFLVVF